MDFRIMNKLMKISCQILFIVLMLVSFSCGGKDVKKASEESRLAQEAFRLAETLKDAYEQNDRSTLEENSTKEGYRELIGAIKKFDRADLAFTPTWLEIKDPAVFLTISWKGTWTVKGKATEERGLAIFVLEGKPLQLARIQRENPFKQPE